MQQVIRQTGTHGGFHLGVVDQLLQGVQVGQQGIHRLHRLGDEARRLVQQAAQQPRLDGLDHVHQVDHPEDERGGIFEEVQRVKLAVHHLIDAAADRPHAAR